MTDPPRRNIFCELTPPGRGGISTLGLFGPEVLDAVRRIFRSCRPLDERHERIVYGHIVGDDERSLDEVIVHVADAANVEVHCHGGPAAVEAVARRLESQAVERCAWNAFLRIRAEVEGVGRIVLDAELLLPRLAALKPALVVTAQRNGLLAAAVRRAGDLIGEGRRDEALRLLGDLLRSYARTGRFIERPPRVAILGPANSGKSSLMNRLVGAERMIVTDIPGTTRDVVTEMAAFDGLPVVLADTAGLRPAADAVEEAGIQRARAEVLAADVLLVMHDLSGRAEAVAGLEPQDLSGDGRPPFIRVGTKADLVGGSEIGRDVDVVTSSVTGQGTDELTRTILGRLSFRWPQEAEAVPFTAHLADVLSRTHDDLRNGLDESACRRLAPLLPLLGKV
ncbi:MAG: 50S ribosome-binding GTPase [Planctomycetes bacterium]|nr:50S ribosome-binding GTPase [Planctomycetota bacterium]